MNKSVGWPDILDFIILGLLCLFGAGYSLLNRTFAQLHLQLSFLPFPVFIGEILFAVCLILLLLKERLQGYPFLKNKPRSFAAGLIFFLLFIGLKAGTGYLAYGPLAFRNAALFYYIVFVWIAASAYNRRFFQPAVIFSLIFFFTTSIVIRPLNCYMYFMFSYILLSLLLIIRLPQKRIRWMIVSVLFLFIPYLYILGSSRANIVASIAGMCVFLLLYLSKSMVKVRFLRIFVSILVFLFAAAFFVMTFSRTEEIRSLTRIKGFLAQYREANRLIQEKKDDYVMRDVPVQLYSHNKTIDFMTSDSRIIETDTVKMVNKVKQNMKQHSISMSVRLAAGPDAQDDAQILDSETYDKSRNLKDTAGSQAEAGKGDTAATAKASLTNEPTNNILWRILVWKDMLQEVWAVNPVWGVPFGKPFRSCSIEILGWNKMEVDGVGWLEPHNSYVHIIYRAGALGVCLIGLILFLVVRLAIFFVRKGRTTGILLVSILAYWLVVANFLVTYELPFFAIPFWSLMGLTVGYYRDIQAHA